MGCGSTKDAKGFGEFTNGFPEFLGTYADFKIDTCVCGLANGDGMVYRLVDKKKEIWAYYNDTTQLEVHVAVAFSKACEIEALGDTTLRAQDDGEWVARAVVPPLQTVMFIKGRVNGFEAKMTAYTAGRSVLMGNESEVARSLGTPVAEDFETETEVLSPVSVLTPMSTVLSIVVVRTPQGIAA